MKKIVGKVTEDEKNELVMLFEQHQLLSNMVTLINNPYSTSKEEDRLTDEERDILYEKLIGNIEKSKLSFDCWWYERSKKYQWPKLENTILKIDFQTNEVYY